jgi:UDP-N-acetylglucosamine--N-acetylmuramyl-(pentapeptide) pyrophosphoryl-undecaprenol N-acetylglucosamine transferase
MSLKTINDNYNMKVIFSGGGTLGPVTPLLAMHEVISKHYKNTNFLWVGTKDGPEKPLIEQKGINFVSVTSGKIRRYWSLLNLVDPIKIFIGFLQSVAIVWKENPSLCISAGGYVSAPLHWAAWLFGVPTWIHQQDVRVGLSNKLMAPFANVITVALQDQEKHFSHKKTTWIGNPVRADVLSGSKQEAKKIFELSKNLPVVLAMGGGTGSLVVNQLVMEAIPHLQGFAQIIHLTGIERPQGMAERAEKQFNFYHVYRFLTDEMKHALAVADLIVSRGGFGSLTEIAALKKPAVIIPKPGHQYDNTRRLNQSGAADFVDERTSNGIHLAGLIKDILRNELRMRRMGKILGDLLPRAKEESIIRVIENLNLKN